MQSITTPDPGHCIGNVSADVLHKTAGKNAKIPMNVSGGNFTILVILTAMNGKSHVRIVQCIHKFTL